MRKGIYGLVLENRRVLVVEKQGKYILPGGKPNSEDETEFDTLKREFRKELSGTEILVDLYYRDFSGISPNSPNPILTKNYFCYPVNNVGEPSAEITDKRYVNSSDLGNLVFSEITNDVLVSLIKDNLID